MLECDTLAGARAADFQPQLRAGLISFELIPLVAYPGFARLFAPHDPA
mgnify:CR=1 FL=1